MFLCGREITSLKNIKPHGFKCPLPSMEEHVLKVVDSKGLKTVGLETVDKLRS
jgi:hypothetical protein